MRTNTVPVNVRVLGDRTVATTRSFPGTIAADFTESVSLPRTSGSGWRGSPSTSAASTPCRDVTFEARRRRGPRPLRRERGGQEHADEDPGRRDHRLRGARSSWTASRSAFAGPRDAEDAGIRIIHQELNLVPDLSVAANIFLGRERTAGRSACSTTARWRPRRRRLFDRLGTPISPRARVGDLRIGDQQMVEIAKALAFDAAILIMDEPTSALSDAEVARLFRVIDDLRAGGHDRPLHLAQDERGVHPGRPRDRPPRRPVRGHRRPRARPSPAQVVRWMVGREIAEMTLDDHPVAGEAILPRSRACRCPARPTAAGRRSADLRFEVRAGRGPGRRRPARRRADRAARSPLRRQPRSRRPGRSRSTAGPSGSGARRRRSPPASALVTEDRKTLGLFDQMTVAENITICHLDALARAGLIDRRAEARGGGRARSTGWRSRPPAAARSITSLSGGNQQKCILARWLLTEPQGPAARRADPRHRRRRQGRDLRPDPPPGRGRAWRSS